MGFPMSQRHAVTKAFATRYKRTDKAGKGRILDESCATTGWHHNHARRGLRWALKPRSVRPAGAEVADLWDGSRWGTAFTLAVLGAPTGSGWPRCWGQ